MANKQGKPAGTDQRQADQDVKRSTTPSPDHQPQTGAPVDQSPEANTAPRPARK